MLGCSSPLISIGRTWRSGQEVPLRITRIMRPISLRRDEEDEGFIEWEMKGKSEGGAMQGRIGQLDERRPKCSVAARE